MSIENDTMCMHYTLERLKDIKTQSDLTKFQEEIIHNLKVNEDWRNSNPPTLPEQVYVDPEDFNVKQAIDDIKRDYVERALTRSKNTTEAIQTCTTYMKDARHTIS